MNTFLRIFISLLSIAAEVAVANDCCRVPDELQCLRTNSSYCYRNHYERFYEILDLAEGKARLCKSPRDMAKFLALVEIRSGNAEFNEYLDETIEELCITKSKCFVDAMKNLRPSTRKEITRRLQTPTFYETDNLLKGCLRE